MAGWTDFLQGLLENTSDCFQAIAPDGRLQYVNATWCQVLGYEPEEVLGRSLFELIHPQDRDRCRHALQTLGNDSQPVMLTATLLAKNGFPIFWEGEFQVCKIGNRKPEIWGWWRDRLPESETHTLGNVAPDSEIVRCDIERAEAQAALRESQHFTQKLIDTIPQIVYLFDVTAGRAIYINRQLTEVLGYSVEEFYAAGAQWLPEKMHPDDQHLIVSLPHRFAELPDQGVLTTEYRLRHQNGEWCWLQSREVIFSRDDQGAPKQILGSVQNITDRKHAEIELNRQCQRSQLFAEITLKIRQSLRLEDILQTTVTEIQKLLQADRVLMFRVHDNGEGTVVQEAVVPQHLPILGHRIHDPCLPQYLGEYRQGRINTIANLETADLAACHIEMLQTFGVKANLVVPILLANRADEHSPLLWGLLIAHQCDYPREWSDFEVKLLQELADQAGIALSQSQLLESLRESEERFYGAFENAAVGMSIMGLNGQWLQVNHALCRILGYAEAELLSMNFQAVTHPDDLIVRLSYMEQLLRQEIRFFHMEQRFFHKQGHLALTSVSVSLVRDLQGYPLYFVTQVQDITQRKQAEAEILKALAKERELNELKSRFVSMISHEFRTPLTTIQSAAELLEHYQWPAEQKQERFQQIHLAIQQMTQSLEDILLIGKAEAGKLSFQPDYQNFDQFCQKVISEFRLAIAHQHSIVYTTQGKHQPVWCDLKLCRQLLTNLLTNAVKYSPEGGNLGLAVEYQTHSVVLRVSDQGIGIPLADQEHIFDAFYRATNAETIQGTGLGLAIVKRCVDLHHGQITVDSEPGQGTTFSILLPLNPPSPKDTHAHDSSH